MIRAWTEAEIGSHEFGRLGNDVLAQLHARARPRASPRSRPPDLDPTIAALALVAMFERLNYYALAGQVRVERDDIVDTLAARDPARAVRPLAGADARRTRRARAPADRRAPTPGPSTRPRP